MTDRGRSRDAEVSPAHSTNLKGGRTAEDCDSNISNCASDRRRKNRTWEARGWMTRLLPMWQRLHGVGIITRKGQFQ